MRKKPDFSFIAAILFFLTISAAAYSQENTTGIRRLIVFHSLSCSKCIEAKKDFIPSIERDFKDRIVLEYRDTAKIDNYKLLLSLQERHGAKIKNILPVFYLGGRFLDGQGLTQDGIRQFVSRALNSPITEQDDLPAIDLVARFKAFAPLAIVSAGLIDGINPCAFTVIVFFISFLSLQGYKRKDLLFIGLSFIFSVFATYFLIGLGLFSFLYRLKVFWLMAKTVNISVGILSIALGLLSLYDVLKFRLSGCTDGLALQLPKAVKNRIRSVIGWHYRKTQIKKDENIKRSLLKLTVSALVTGHLVSLLEAVCTGQLYLPTIIFVLKTSPLKSQALGRLLLYNLMFCVPLLVIFSLALLGTTSAQFSGFMKRHLLAIKMLLAIIFFTLGVTLIYPYLPKEIRRDKDYGDLPRAGGVVATQPLDVKTYDPFSWDFGQVEEGRVLRHSFILKNESAKALTIKDVNTSCGCTIIKAAKTNLLPEETTSIEVQFDTAGYSGQAQQYVYVHTDSLDNPIIRYIIKADVIKK